MNIDKYLNIVLTNPPEQVRIFLKSGSLHLSLYISITQRVVYRKFDVISPKNSGSVRFKICRNIGKPGSSSAMDILLFRSQRYVVVVALPKTIDKLIPNMEVGPHVYIQTPCVMISALVVH